ncbi:MAG TPA: germacradienol/geosmin synthase, partial [Candidatus Nanopelagicales bacterium]|nr:germacradienol/geosmin synthase [Candidatus Nanopelagicales bacterium]
MQPFELPDFYMPYPARLNPHLEGARAHCKAWAIRMGLLGSEPGSEGGALWSEGRFDAMDFAHFTALTHPDVPAPELDLLSDWYVWGWFMDDYCSRSFEQGNDAGGAREYVSRVLEFLPEDLGAPTPAPANPVERALADLWPRTAPTMSPAWRRRYAGTLRRLADAYLKDIQGAGKERVLDPVEYVGLRREVSGVFWSADLVEHSLGVEIPDRIYDSRPVRVLRDVFADVVGLRNDVISYNIDVAEGRVNNAVMVMAHFLGCDLQRAAEVVNDLVTSRLYQFENT